MRNRYELFEEVLLQLELWQTETHYTNSSLHNNEFVGRVPYPINEIETLLLSEGFEQVSEKSWRLPEGETHIHIFLYSSDEHTFIYAHQEERFFGERNGGEAVRRMKKLLDENGFSYEPIRP